MEIENNYTSWNMVVNSGEIYNVKKKKTFEMADLNIFKYSSDKYADKEAIVFGDTILTMFGNDDIYIEIVKTMMNVNKMIPYNSEKYKQGTINYFLHRYYHCIGHTNFSLDDFVFTTDASGFSDEIPVCDIKIEKKKIYDMYDCSKYKIKKVISLYTDKTFTKKCLTLKEVINFFENTEDKNLSVYTKGVKCLGIISARDYDCKNKEARKIYGENIFHIYY